MCVYDVIVFCHVLASVKKIAFFQHFYTSYIIRKRLLLLLLLPAEKIPSRLSEIIVKKHSYKINGYRNDAVLPWLTCHLGRPNCGGNITVSAQVTCEPG